MLRRPPSPHLTHTLFPAPTLFRSRRKRPLRTPVIRSLRDNACCAGLALGHFAVTRVLRPDPSPLRGSLDRAARHGFKRLPQVAPPVDRKSTRLNSSH